MKVRLDCFETRYGVLVRWMKNWQGIPTFRLNLGGEVMVPRDNSTLAFSTEFLNYIIAFATQRKSGHNKIFDGWPRGFLFATLKILLQSLKMPAKVTGDSLPFHEFTYTLFIGIRSVTSNMTSYSHSYHSIKLIHCGVPQRDVLSDKMVFWVVTHSFYFMLCQSSLSSTVISFVYKDKLWFDESMSVIFYMENTWKRILLFPLHINSSLN